jgi:hypothetical protein
MFVFRIHSNNERTQQNKSLELSVVLGAGKGWGRLVP